VGSAPPGVSSAGALDGADTFLLGDAQLEGVLELAAAAAAAEGAATADDDDETPFTFMTGLTASALQIASPASAGLLGTAFLNCFQGGVEFQWGVVSPEGQITSAPSITFHGEVEPIDASLSSRPRAKIVPLDVTLLPSLTVTINGQSMPALLDTGSPITVLNSIAAKLAGVDVVDLPEETNNPFTKVANNVKIAQAAGRGELLQIAGSNGQPVNLLKSTASVDICIVGCDDGEKTIEFGCNPIFVGDLPGLAALNGIGVDCPPAVVLGVDVLRQRPKMLFRGQQLEVFF